MGLQSAVVAVAIMVLVFGPIGCRHVDEPETASSAVVAPTMPVIPLPARIEARDGSFALTPDTRILVPGGAPEALRVARDFAALIQRTRGFLPHVEASGGTPPTSAGAIVFALDPQAHLSGDEAYTLDITAQGVRIAARAPAGLFYGAVTAWQLATADGGSGPAAIPAQRIDDAPRFAWRGLMLDSARHFQSVEEIKRLLDAMALHKLNTFHWHLTDDQGWRIEIKRYPKLTEVGGCRIPAGDGGIDPRTGKPRPYCGYYTQAQIRDIVALRGRAPYHRRARDRRARARSRGDRGLSAARRAARQAACGVERMGRQHLPVQRRGGHLRASSRTCWPKSSNCFPARTSTSAATRRSRTSGRPRRGCRRACGARRRRRSGDAKLFHRAPGQVPDRARPSPDRLGRDPRRRPATRGDRDVVARRSKGAHRGRRTQGHDVVMSPSTRSLLRLPADRFAERAARSPGHHRRCARSMPSSRCPPRCDAGKRHHILGMQANIWTEHMRSFARVQHAIFPRIAAVAETGWSPRAAKDYPDRSCRGCRRSCGATMRSASLTRRRRSRCA